VKDRFPDSHGSDVYETRHHCFIVVVLTVAIDILEVSSFWISVLLLQLCVHCILLDSF